jgi:hypothetical protein
MKEYFHWSLRQLYLICFWPTQFKREVEGEAPEKPRLQFVERLRYLGKMLLCIVVFAAFGNFIAGRACEISGIVFKWREAWISVAGGVAVGFAVSLAGSLTIGLAGSLVAGLTAGLAVGLAGDVEGGLALGLALGVVLGLAVDAGRSGALDLGEGLVFGLGGGMAVGLVFGLGGGMAVGLASCTAWWLTYFRLATFPFDAALSTLAYFVAKLRPHAATRTWRWCPLVWNEVIWLPLPFISKLLALLVQQNREMGFKQIALVAAERKPQRRAVVAALLEVAITDLQAHSITGLARAVEKLAWITDSPATLPDEWNSFLPRFDRAAQHVEQYLALHNAYRKSEALSRAITGIEALQRSLIVARGRFAPQLLLVANEWRRLLDAEQKIVSAQAAASREIPNPFVFGNPVTETEANTFAGRQDIVKKIEASILGAMQSPTLLLHGSRRMGKTSILNQLPRLLGPDFAPALVDCQNPAVIDSLASLLRYLSRALSNGLRRHRVTVEPLTASTLEREPFAAFDDWLNLVEEAMPEGMRALLCLDEYERLQTALDLGWGAAFLDSLRHLLQHRRRIVLMFTGAHTFAELGPAWTDRFISARRVRVSFLTREELLPLLTKPIPEFDMTYAPGALDVILATTSGQPFLTQAVAFELVQYLNEQQRKEATPADSEEAIARALISGGEYFANVWSDAKESGQAILQAIVRDEPPPDSSSARKWLREHDVLNDAGDFAVPMMRSWVEEKTSEDGR